VYYRFQNEVRPPGTYLRWEVTGDMVMRRQIAAKVSPDYSLGFSDVKLSIPSKTQGDLGFSSPQVSIGPSQIKTHGPLHQIADPAIQAMGIATAYVSGCCSVSNPNRDQCLSRFQTIDDYRIRNTPEVPKTPSDTSR
jgi:hypothetical protein